MLSRLLCFFNLLEFLETGAPPSSDLTLSPGATFSAARVTPTPVSHHYITRVTPTPVCSGHTVRTRSLHDGHGTPRVNPGYSCPSAGLLMSERRPSDATARLLQTHCTDAGLARWSFHLTAEVNSAYS